MLKVFYATDTAELQPGKNMRDLRENMEQGVFSSPSGASACFGSGKFAAAAVVWANQQGSSVSRGSQICCSSAR